MIERVIWPQDWNRPLSLEEQRIGERIDCAPDSGLEALLCKRASRLQAESTRGGVGKRRSKDAPCSAAGDEARKLGRFGEGLE